MKKTKLNIHIKKGQSDKCNSVPFIGGTLFWAPSVGLGRSGCFPETGQTAACSHSVGLVHSKTGSKIWPHRVFDRRGHVHDIDRTTRSSHFVQSLCVILVWGRFTCISLFSWKKNQINKENDLNLSKCMKFLSTLTLFNYRDSKIFINSIIYLCMHYMYLIGSIYTLMSYLNKQYSWEAIL